MIMQDMAATLKTSVLSVHAIPLWVPFLITLVTAPVFILLARYTGLLDDPENKRKIHENQKPLGGASVLLGFLPVYFYYGPTNFYLVAGLALVFLAGLLDDFRGLNPRIKLLVQVLAALVLVTNVPLPASSFGLGDLQAVTLSGAGNRALIGFWLVGGTNAFNLIDGLDGLAAGLGLIALVPVILLTVGTPVYVLVAALAGSLLGFLIYNFHPAKLFLGDGGSYFLGFLLSYLLIQGLGTAGTAKVIKSWPLVTGLFLILLPVLDTSMAIIRRIRSSKGVMKPDRNHIHHIIYRKYGQKRAVLIMYAIQAVCAVTGILLVF